jgi:phosphoglycerol transferase MdoB-like AlkP superfamily enzyme
MPIHAILLILSAVLLVLAGVIEWPRSNNPAPGYGHPLGWFGLAALVLAMIVP